MGTVESKQIVNQLVTAPDGPGKRLNLPQESISALSNQFFDGLMTQLRSIPIGLRLDAWIIREYPELSELQQKSATRQLQENLQAVQLSWQQGRGFSTVFRIESGKSGKAEGWDSGAAVIISYLSIIYREYRNFLEKITRRITSFSEK